MLSLCKITERPAVSPSALYTLAMATEGNGEFYEGKKHMYINLKQLLPHIQLVKLYDKQKSNSFCMRYVCLTLFLTDDSIETLSYCYSVILL